MGPSGCGKTTLLRILLGLEAPDSGNIQGLENRKLSAVFQEDRLCENLSAYANIRLVCPSSVTKDMISKELTLVGLEGSEQQPIRELSGGMKRRVAILRGLMADWDILLMDEPLRGLDTTTRDLVIKRILEKGAGKTIILVTHDEEEVRLLGAKPFFINT